MNKAKLFFKAALCEFAALECGKAHAWDMAEMWERKSEELHDMARHTPSAVNVGCMPWPGKEG